MARQCSTCKYYYEHDGTIQGDDPHCRRYPPIHIGPERTMDGFVRVRTNLYCGEYKKKRRR